VSRGYGYVQRFVLEALDEQSSTNNPWVHARTLAERIDGSTPTKHTRRSLRRAVQLLAADGLVEIAPHTGIPHTAGRAEGMLCRIAPTRMDDVVSRRARRSKARELRRELAVNGAAITGLSSST
jgi:hypothetical protein